MTIRFFILSAHYRGTVDFSNDALMASEKGLERLMNGLADLDRVKVAAESDADTHRLATTLATKCYEAMNDDLATPQVISHLFEACTVVNKLVDHKATISEADFKLLADTTAHLRLRHPRTARRPRCRQLRPRGSLRKGC